MGNALALITGPGILIFVICLAVVLFVTAWVYDAIKTIQAVEALDREEQARRQSRAEREENKDRQKRMEKTYWLEQMVGKYGFGRELDITESEAMTAFQNKAYFDINLDAWKKRSGTRSRTKLYQGTAGFPTEDGRERPSQYQGYTNGPFWSNAHAGGFHERGRTYQSPFEESCNRDSERRKERETKEEKSYAKPRHGPTNAEVNMELTTTQVMMVKLMEYPQAFSATSSIGGMSMAGFNAVQMTFRPEAKMDIKQRTQLIFSLLTKFDLYQRTMTEYLVFDKAKTEEIAWQRSRSKFWITNPINITI